MEEDDVQEEEEIDEDDEDKDEDEEDMEDMEVEEEVAVVPLQDSGRWKCPLCTVPYAYKNKKSAVRHIASGPHN